jgi:hypothetical protein
MDLILQWGYQREPKLGWCVFRTYAYNFICLWEGYSEVWSVHFYTGAVLVTESLLLGMFKGFHSSVDFWSCSLLKEQVIQ